MENDKKVFNILKKLNNIDNNVKVDSKEAKRLLDVIKKESAVCEKQDK